MGYESVDTIVTTTTPTPLEPSPETHGDSRRETTAASDSLRALVTLADAGQAAAESESLDEALRTIAWRAAETLQVPECVIWEYDPRSDTIIPRAHYERTPSGWDGLRKPLPLAHHQPKKRVIESGLPLFETLSDPHLHPVSRERMVKWGIESSLSIPLLSGAERVGLMAFHDSEPDRHFSEAEMALARGVGSLASLAIHFAQTMRRHAEQNVRLASLLQASWAINSSLDVDDVIQIVADHAASSLGCDGCVIYPAGLDHYHTPSQDDPERTPLQQHVDDPGLDSAVRTTMEAQGHRSRLVIPLPVGPSRLGALVAYRTEAQGRFTPWEIDLACGLAAQAGLAIRNAQQYQELRQVHVAGLRALVSALGAKEPYTQGHGARVAQYVSLLTEKLGWDAEAVHRAEEAGFLHDIGKLVVSDGVLLKPGPLTEREWALMRTHPETSREILLSMVDDEQAEAICHHHERYDGSGYPSGLAGEAIPLLARALSVVDAYDAMSYHRPYRWALPYAECRAELIRGCGVQFDPAMVDAFLEVLDELAQRRMECVAVAEEAAVLIDAEKHEILRSREDEDRPEYKELVEILGAVLRRHEGMRFLTTQRKEGARLIYVVDPEESEEWKSHIGDDLYTADYETGEVLQGLKPDANAIYADEFGTWVTGTAPICDAEGKVVALVAADTPVRPPRRSTDGLTVPGSMESLLGELSKRISRAEFAASTDGLTGVHNHRHLHEHLTGEVSKAVVRQSQVAVLFVDIDHFKAFNDRWGHVLGDEVLRAVALIVEGQIRRDDIVARYGGEEFVAVLSDTGLAGGLHVAERIREKITATPLVPGTAKVTVSIGVAVFPEHAASKTELIEKADAAMYEAKRLGRDRVQVYRGGEPGPAPTT
ncbi:MAG: diguanylate cyclase [Thermoleophilia bacterium]|nr:diguanylate cyclase [Thermoleophilia bacterium]